MTDIYPCSCFNGSCPVVLAYEIYQFGNGTQIYTTVIYYIILYVTLTHISPLSSSNHITSFRSAFCSCHELLILVMFPGTGLWGETEGLVWTERIRDSRHESRSPVHSGIYANVGSCFLNSYAHDENLLLLLLCSDPAVYSGIKYLPEHCP